MEMLKLSAEEIFGEDVNSGEEGLCPKGFELINCELHTWDPDSRDVQWAYILKRESDNLYFKWYCWADGVNWDDELVQTIILPKEFHWTIYSWENRDSHPPKVGKYLIYRAGCSKMHFEQWNGSGWSSSNRDCTHWSDPKIP